ncbi:hypothetical protein Tco_0656076 [Tanacetum coccineum]|uniref:Uncharacterized protein n=1 Tax=Tanacetum coccineum TaxID=301880 RepID=A0ABQ4X7R7_9ASTR
MLCDDKSHKMKGKSSLQQRAAEQRSKPPTKTQIRNRMCAYLKNIGRYKHNQLKGRSYEEIQKLFDKACKQVNSFVPIDSEVVKSSVTKTKGSFKRAGDELESDKSKKQKIDEHVEAEKDNDQEEAEMKKHIEIVKDDEVAIDAIPLATKPPMIVKYKIVKEGKVGYFQLIRADGSLKRYLSMIKMLQNIDREDLETLWKLVKAKHGNKRPEEDYERIIWGDLKVMFEPDIKSEVWRYLHGYKVTIWKLFDTCGVHFVRFKNLHIFMLVEKRYPLTPITITNMLNKKLQADHWKEILLMKKLKDSDDEHHVYGRTIGFKRLQDILRVTAAQINTAYSLPLNTAYRSSVTESESSVFLFDFRAKKISIQKEPILLIVYPLFQTLSLDELRSPDFNLLSDQEYSEEEVAETMAETMEQYMSKTQADYGSGIARPRIEDRDNFELKSQFLKELRTNTFSGSDHEIYSTMKNYLGREIKKVNEKVYAAKVGYTLSKFTSESAKRHEENSNLIKEIRASTDAAIRNQGESIKTLKIQIEQMSKVLQERGFGSLPSSTKANSRDQVKSISTTIEVDSYPIRCIRSS